MTTREIILDEDVPIQQRMAYKAGDVAGKYRHELMGVGILVLKLVAGLALIFFGLVNTGSFYTNAGKMGGMLATIFYEYQAGTLMACVGSILLYDLVKGYFK